MFVPLSCYWQDRPWDRLVKETCDEWVGTPYMLGQQMKGRAVDCVHFVTGVLNALYGTHREIPVLRGDTAWHDKEKAFKALRTILRNFPSDDVEGSLETGDVIWTGPHNGAPSHAMIVGGMNVLYHAPGPGQVVCKAPLGYDNRIHPGLRILRPREKHLW